MNDPILIRSGFDTIELAYRAAIPEKFLSLLADAKSSAIEKRKPIPIRLTGVSFLVEATGGQGGFAYRVDTGPFGAVWKFREKGSKDAWQAHVKIKSHGLATKGLNRCKLECDDFLRAVGASFDHNDARVGRADFAFDFYAPDLKPQITEIVSHARTYKSDLIERGSRGDKTEYIRIGKMPGKQVCIYYKTGAIDQKGDLIWTEILKTAAKEKDIHFGDRTLGIWRIEFRSGKKHIDKFLAPNRRWDLFETKYKYIFENTCNTISWRQKQGDSNRARWPLHPTWNVIQKNISALNDAKNYQIPEQVLTVIRDEYLGQLDSQIEGLFLTVAANNGVASQKIEEFVISKCTNIHKRLAARSDLWNELKERAERFRGTFSPFDPQE